MVKTAPELFFIIAEESGKAGFCFNMGTVREACCPLRIKAGDKVRHSLLTQRQPMKSGIRC